jgi:ubiquinone/menaquinone biosynthesis C-methylase UbiE
MQAARWDSPRHATGCGAGEASGLARQSALYNAITRRVLGEAGLRPGMRVLDAGTGAGDVALLAAELVGPAGSVVGIDRNPAVLEIARVRARSAGLANVTFVAGDLRDPAPGRDFDAVLGRLVLMHVPDPAAALRHLCHCLRPGGIVAFQECNLAATALDIWPPTPLWGQVRCWLYQTIRSTSVDLEMGYKLYHVFREAGLPEPRLHLDAPIGGGPAYDGHEIVAEMLHSLLPLAQHLGIAAAAVNIETLADRLRAETSAAGGVVKVPDLVSAWTRLP